MNEIWKDIKEYEGLYQVNTIGIIRNKSGRLRKPEVSNSGHYRINLSKEGRVKKYLVHRIVANHFLPYSKLNIVNHIDGNKLNNCRDNLEWVSYSDNLKHAYREGLRSALGSNNGMSKLQESQVLEIREMYKSIKISYVSLSKKFNVSPKCVENLLKRKTWKHL